MCKRILKNSPTEPLALDVFCCSKTIWGTIKYFAMDFIVLGTTKLMQLSR